ncbi:hypothetical protein [Granulicatella adiacens]
MVKKVVECFEKFGNKKEKRLQENYEEFETRMKRYVFRIVDSDKNITEDKFEKIIGIKKTMGDYIVWIYTNY